MAANFPKKRIWNPARIPPQTPPAGGKRAEAKRKILFPRKTDFRFAESALKSHALPEYLEGRTPKENTLSISKKFPARKSKKQGVFSFRVAEQSEAVAGRSPSVRFSFASPRTRSVRHHLFWK